MWSNKPDTVKLLLDAKANTSDVKSNASLERIRQLSQYPWTLEILLPTLDKLRLYQYLQDRQTQAQCATASSNLTDQEQETS